jgi:UDPglucose--hexose-1-phosphate uridylyltransferase
VAFSRTVAVVQWPRTGRIIEQIVTELRKDWLSGRTVLLAENRALRPNEFADAGGGSAAPLTAANCPFCPGQESSTPPAVFTETDAAGHWQVRVVPNKYPAVETQGDSPAAGAHEVIIESARHVDRTSALTAAELAAVLDAYRRRLAHWRASGRFRYGLVFKNLGAAAGASLAHVHSQLIALPEVPQPVAAELARAKQFYAEQGACAYCRLIADERHARERVVLDRDGFIAFCPLASLQPGEVWLLPTEHEPWFEGRPAPTGADHFAEILHGLLARIEGVLPQPSYNLLVRTTPWQDDAAAAGHWRIEILPRVNPLAGVELATQIYINPISPTRAAQQLRSS